MYILSRSPFRPHRGVTRLHLGAREDGPVRPEGKERQYITSLNGIRLLCSVDF